MAYKEYVQRLGYGGDLGRHVFTITVDDDGEEDEVPELCNVLAKWPNGAVTAHFKVPNTVLGFFDALDEVGDPAKVSCLWCCDAEADGYLDTDCSEVIVWPPQ